MTPTELRSIAWATIDMLSNSIPETANVSVSKMREALESFGLKPGCHVGKTDLTPDEVAEWYIGQGLSIIDKEHWVSMSSWLGSAQQFLGDRPTSNS